MTLRLAELPLEIKIEILGRCTCREIGRAGCAGRALGAHVAERAWEPLCALAWRRRDARAHARLEAPRLGARTDWRRCLRDWTQRRMRWRPLALVGASAPEPRFLHRATVPPDGRSVYLFGGSDTHRFFNDV